MHQSQSRFFVLLTFTCLIFAAARTSMAETKKFPADDPAFTMEVPSGWTCKTGKDRNFECNPGDDSAYTFSIVALDTVHNEKELSAELPELAKSMASGADLRNFEMQEVEHTANDKGIEFTGLAGRGKAGDASFVVMVNAFAAAKGKYYALITAGLERADRKHHADYEAIAASITPLHSQSKGNDGDLKPPGTEESADVTQANARLDSVYQRLMGKLDADGQKALKESERSWMKWRDDEAMLMARAGGAVGGSALRVDFANAQVKLVNQRIEALNDYLKKVGQ